VQSFENSMRPQDITNTLKVIGDIVGVDLSLSTQ
jgi:hypothetical protein